MTKLKLLLILIFVIVTGCIYNNKINKKTGHNDDLSFLNNPSVSVFAQNILGKSAKLYQNISTYSANFELKFYSFDLPAEKNNSTTGELHIKKPLFGKMEVKKNPFYPELNGSIKINTPENYYEFVPAKNEYVLTKSCQTIFPQNDFSKSFSLVDALSTDNPIKALVGNFIAIRCIKNEKINNIPIIVLEIKRKNSTKYLWIGENDFIIYKVLINTTNTNGILIVEETQSNMEINTQISDDKFLISPLENTKKVENISIK